MTDALGELVDATRLIRLETVRPRSNVDVLFVRLFTGTGLVGLGEAYSDAAQVERYLHRVAAPALLGLSLGRCARRLGDLVTRARSESAAARRGASALDIALWDLAGRSTGQSVSSLLGGQRRAGIRVYNSVSADLPNDGRAVLKHAEDLAARQITAMKMRPLASLTGSVTSQDVRSALRRVKQLRRSLGDQVDLIFELERRWDLPTATRIGREVESLDPIWLDEPLRPDDLGSIAAYARAVRVPFALREPLASNYPIRDLLERRIAGIVNFSLGWSGGVSRASSVVTMADEFRLPVALYGRVGPIVLSAAAQVGLAAPNVIIQEIVQDYVDSWYRDLVADLPRIVHGVIRPPAGDGHGVDLLPDLLTNRWSVRRATTHSSV